MLFINTTAALVLLIIFLKKHASPPAARLSDRLLPAPLESDYPEQISGPPQAVVEL